MNLSKTRVLIALTGLAALFSVVTIKAISTSASAVAFAQASDEKGIDNAAAVLGGYDALVKAGFPTETSN